MDDIFFVLFGIITYLIIRIFITKYVIIRKYKIKTIKDSWFE